MAEKEDLQKQLSTTRDENVKLMGEVKTLETDVAAAQVITCLSLFFRNY